MTERKASTEVAKATSQEVVTQDGSISSADVLRWFTDPFPIEAIKEDPDDVARRIEARILGAQTPADLFSPPEVLHGKEYLGKSFLLRGVEWRPSADQYQDGLPIYGVFHIVDSEGTAHVMTCAGRNVVEKAAVAHVRGWLPLWLKLIQGEKTDAGFYPLDLVAGVEPVPGDESKGEKPF